MIFGLTGKIKDKKENILLIEVNGISYEVFIPDIILNSINREYKVEDEIKLFTFHYNQLSPSRSTPILIGFTNEIEREFFIKFISVSGVGPKVAVKALNKPISMIVKAIDNSNVNQLSSLPGIGRRKAKEIIAKLQGKVGKYGLIQDSKVETEDLSISEDIKQEAIEILLQLRYTKKEAQDMINRASIQNPKLSSVEDLLNQVYKHSKS